MAVTPQLFMGWVQGETPIAQVLSCRNELFTTVLFKMVDSLEGNIEPEFVKSIFLCQTVLF